MLSPIFSSDRTLAEFVAWCEFKGYDALEYHKISPVHIKGSWHYLHKAADICIVGRTDRATFNRLLHEVYPEAQRRGLAVTFPAETNGVGLASHSIGDGLHVHVDCGEWSNLGRTPNGVKAPWTGHDQGFTVAEVKAIQQLVGVKADGVYGLDTLQAVAKEQALHHLEVDGICGPKTTAALSKKPASPATKPSANPGGPVIQSGDTGPEVATLQRLVGVPADSTFGPKTVAAVKRVQKRLGVTADGKWGAKSAAAYDAFVDGKLGRATIELWQSLAKTPKDGKISVPSKLIAKVQKRHHVHADGVLGPETWKTLQRWFGFKGKDVDGVPGPKTVEKLQTNLLRGRW